MKWLFECGSLVPAVPADDVYCPCGLDCDGRPYPEADLEWAAICDWLGWRPEWREQYERGEYPFPDAAHLWIRDGDEVHCIDQADHAIWNLCVEEWGLFPPENAPPEIRIDLVE